MTLAHRLQRLIDERGYTLSEAARAAGMEKQQLHRIVSGRNTNPGIETVRRIVEAIGCEMAELFEDDGRED